jgi:hypothetical protein
MRESNRETEEILKESLSESVHKRETNTHTHTHSTSLLEATSCLFHMLSQWYGVWVGVLRKLGGPRRPLGNGSSSGTREAVTGQTCQIRPVAASHSGTWQSHPQMSVHTYTLTQTQTFACFGLNLGLC